MIRPSKDETFMAIADVLAKRSTCLRRSVGCVIVDANHHILSTGYNGTPAGMPHCDELGCSELNTCSGEGLDRCNAIHAEQNAVARLINPQYAHTIYCTTEPCTSCMKLLFATNIERVVYRDQYNTNHTLVELSNISWEKLNDLY